MMKTILITGGAGFIGSNFARFLYQKYDYYIIILDALTYAGSVNNTPNQGFNNSRYEFWYGSVTNQDIVDSLVSKSDYVFHFAAESHVTRSIFDNKSFFDTDVIGTQVVTNSILRHKKKIKLFAHISTSEVYGTADSNYMDEEHALNPMSPYAAAKCGADRLVYSYIKTYEIPAVIIRPFNNYGMNQHLEKVIPRFITSAILNEPLIIHGDGSARRDFIHVDDTCRALDLILHAPLNKICGEVVNIASSVDLSVKDIALCIANEFGMPIEMKYVGNRPGQVFRHTGDYSKIESLLGWSPSIDFSQGIKSTIKWYLENQDWWNAQRWMRAIPIMTADGKEELH
jgi:dTDP-glucose 4,6-dehydratase